MNVVFCNMKNAPPEIVRFVRHTENTTIISPTIIIRQVLEKYGFPQISKGQAHGIQQAKTTRSEELHDIRLNGTDCNKGAYRRTRP